MAETNGKTSDDSPPSNPPTRPAKVALHKIYALPAPIRTFPLPSFYPSNPLSLVHVVYVWLSQVLFRPPDEPSTTYRGAWSPETRSVHVTDQVAMRALWEHGFFGKGSLSRSEPNWLKREQIRRGLSAGHVSEQFTNQRREDRLRAKWERARIEQETIERTQLEELRAASTTMAATATEAGVELAPNGVSDKTEAPRLSHHIHISPPVGPLQLLQLPNSELELRDSLRVNGLANGHSNGHYSGHSNGDATCHPSSGPDSPMPVSDASIQATPNGLKNDTSAGSNGVAAGPDCVNRHTNGVSPPINGISNRMNGTTSREEPGSHDNPKPLKRQKSVRFSAEVESTTFQHNDPPSPNLSTPVVQAVTEISLAKDTASNGVLVESLQSTSEPPCPPEIKNREHLQLSAEESFYLAFAIGGLAVVDSKKNSELSPLELLRLFADHSFFPPRISSSPSSPGLRTDDPFLVQYVVYHHFRSLGWVPREGVKFGVDWLLYRRGPVFDHAEFGLIVLPSFTHPLWREHEHTEPKRSWHWFFGIQRVLSHVMKSMVLVYVDVPPPEALGLLSDPDGGIAGLLGRYKVREVMVRRWSSNRNR